MSQFNGLFFSYVDKIAGHLYIDFINSIAWNDPSGMVLFDYFVENMTKVKNSEYFEFFVEQMIHGWSTDEQMKRVVFKVDNPRA